MPLDIQYIPSYTVLAARYMVPAGTHIFDDRGHARSCEDMLSFVRRSNTAKSAHEGLYGLAVLDRDWSQPKEEPVLVDECIILPTERVDLNTCSRMVEGLDSALPIYLTATPPGTYAVFRHKGAYEDLPGLFRDIFDNQLPDNAVHYAGGPILELYVNDHENTPHEEREIDVCVPVVLGRTGGMKSVPI